jgi:uroporphyrin-III C-methyltransferase/precorrin-2 dehydrogenase/sirohydrochlorin ferrochelatase
VRPHGEVFPIFLKLNERPVLVVGGGVVATGKIGALLQAGARITVVAPEIADPVRLLPVTLRERAFVPEDLDGHWLVVAAAPPEVNRFVAEHAHARHLFVNAVDDPANASAYLGGIVRRDGVTFAISTNGQAPAIAGLLREGLEAVLPADLETWMTRAEELKREWRATGVPMEARRPRLLDALVRLYEQRDSGSTAQPGDGVPLVSLVGAGPGDPDLLTTRAVSRLKNAELVLYDGLVSRAILDLAPRAEQLSVARRAGDKDLTQDAVSQLMIDAARAGRRVVRLKSGDPFVFGRGGEEAAALAEAGIPFEIVPGISSALAAPALAGIPVTHRGVSAGFLVVNGHAIESYEPILSSVSPDVVTLIVLMGVGARATIRATLTRAGWSLLTPAAIVTNASRPDQHVWTGTLDSLDSGRDISPLDEAGVIVIGPVVSLAAAGGIPVPFVSEEIQWLSMTTHKR